MYGKVLLIMAMLLVAGCAPALTSGGHAVKVLGEGEAKTVAGCLRLGSVAGESPSFLSSGDYGVFHATTDARNKAALLPGADTLLITADERRRLGGQVTGVVYDCSRPAEAPTRKLPSPIAAQAQVSPAPAAQAQTVFEKAKKCQAKGGVWIDDRCVIAIE